MSSQNFKIKNGLSVNGQQVIDGSANGYFNVLTANSLVVTGGLPSTDQYARDTANSAGIYANTGINNAASASLYANTGINNATSASLYANSGITLAQSAYDSSNTKLNLTGGIISGNVTANSFIANNSVYTPIIHSQGSGSNIELSDIGIIGINPSGGSGTGLKIIGKTIEGSKFYGGTYGQNFLSVNNETKLSSLVYDSVKIITGGDQTEHNTWDFANNQLIFPDNTYQNTAFTGVGIDQTSRNIANSAGIYANTGINNAASASLYANAGITLAQSAYDAQNSTAIVANAAVTATSTTTLTNKRITLRSANNGATLSGNLTPDADTTDQYNIIGINGTTNIQTPSGASTEGQKLIIRIEDGGTGQTLTWNTAAGAYRVIGTTLPTTTTASKTIYVGCIYNVTDSCWDVVAVATQA